MPIWRGTGEVPGRSAYAFSPERPSAVCLFGRVGQRTGDRDCESAELNGASSDLSGLGWGKTPPRTEPQKPRHGRSPRGGVLHGSVKFKGAQIS
jgi:hypothetical protein